MDGWTGYVVYRPGQNAAILDLLKRSGFPAFDRIMIDIETWPVNGVPQITGNRSVEINALALGISDIVGKGNVWGYGNQGDLASLWPSRPSWVPLVIASYGGSRPTVPNMIGWQYTDGQYSVPGLPNSSAPFGHCDHNELYLDLSVQGGGVLLEDTLTAAEVADIKAYIDAKVGAAVSMILYGDGPNVDDSANTHPNNIARTRRDIANLQQGTNLILNGDGVNVPPESDTHPNNLKRILLEGDAAQQLIRQCIDAVKAIPAPAAGGAVDTAAIHAAVAQGIQDGLAGVSLTGTTTLNRRTP
jgi:hypothetical protein